MMQRFTLESTHALLAETVRETARMRRHAYEQAQRLELMESQCQAMQEVIGSQAEMFRTMRRQVAELHQDVFHLIQALQENERLTA